MSNDITPPGYFIDGEDVRPGHVVGLSDRSRWTVRTATVNYRSGGFPSDVKLQARADDGSDRDIWFGLDEQVWVEADTASSASRQHYIDTGRYLLVGEVEDR